MSGASAPKAPWRLVFAKPQRERTALDNLRRQGYEAYLPLCARRHRPGAQPLFPRYLFVRLADAAQSWRPIRSTKGVTRLVSFGAAAPQVPEALVAALQAREGPDGLLPCPDTPLRPGDEVEFADPALRQCQAIFRCAKGADRVVLLLDIAGQRTPATVPAAAVRPRFPQPAPAPEAA